jgi:hypothetical protein
VDKIFRNTTKAEAAQHDGCPVADVTDRFISVGDNFVHTPRF